MKNKVFLIVSVAVIIAGSIVSRLALFEQSDLVGFAITMLGAGLAVSNLWKKRSAKVKTSVTILAMSLVGLGSFFAGLTGALSESQVTTVIGYVFSFGSIAVGTLIDVVATKVIENK